VRIPFHAGGQNDGADVNPASLIGQISRIQDYLEHSRRPSRASTNGSSDGLYYYYFGNVEIHGNQSEDLVGAHAGSAAASIYLDYPKLIEALLDAQQIFFDAARSTPIPSDSLYYFIYAHPRHQSIFTLLFREGGQPRLFLATNSGTTQRRLSLSCEEIGMPPLQWIDGCCLIGEGDQAEAVARCGFDPVRGALDAITNLNLASTILSPQETQEQLASSGQSSRSSLPAEAVAVLMSQPTAYNNVRVALMSTAPFMYSEKRLNAFRLNDLQLIKARSTAVYTLTTISRFCILTPLHVERILRFLIDDVGLHTFTVRFAPADALGVVRLRSSDTARSETSISARGPAALQRVESSSMSYDRLFTETSSRVVQRHIGITHHATRSAVTSERPRKDLSPLCFSRLSADDWFTRMMNSFPPHERLPAKEFDKLIGCEFFPYVITYVRESFLNKSAKKRPREVGNLSEQWGSSFRVQCVITRMNEATSDDDDDRLEL
jgi:hypothetical protein